MEPFKSILVDIDATAPAHPALERAVRLARASGARLTVTDVMNVPSYARRYLPPQLEEEMAATRRQQLAGLAQSVRDVAVESKLLSGRPATALVQEVLRSGHDLVVRSHSREVASGGPKPFGSIDLELLRKCPCPVMLVRHGVLDPHPQVAGAVDASTDDPAEQALNRKIVEVTLLIAELEGGVASLLQAWQPFAEMTVRSHTSADAFAAYVEDVRNRTAEDLRQLAASFGDRLSGVQTVHQRGAAEDVIPAYVVSHGVDLVVVGTAARSGVAGLLIGNTAERVLGRLPCSVLAVKPDGFVSPVRVGKN